MKIYLSPSLQGNKGVDFYGTEKWRMNQLTDYIEKLLVKYDHEVKRNTPDMTLKEVVQESNNFNPDLHLALHSNAFNGQVRGMEIFCHQKGGMGEKFAQKIYKYLSPLTPPKDRGIKEGYNYYGAGKHMYELAYTKAPAILIEVGFHDNVDDARWIIENMEVIAIAIVNGINEIGGVKYEDYENIDYKVKYENLLKELEELLERLKRGEI